jgi:AraC-like DNA-binding protein
MLARSGPRGVEASAPPPVLLEAGDLAVLPHGRAHRLLATPHSRALSLREVFARTGYDGAGPLCFDGPPAEGTVPAQTVCGKFLLDDGLAAGTPPELRNPLLAALPPLIVVRGERGRAQPWLEGTLAFFACESESGRPGARTVLSRLADILFIQAIRAHLSEATGAAGSACGGGRGYLVALTDAALAPALRAIHRRPEEPWTVASLAREACLSRSAFAARFAQLVGEPPLQYLTRWRLYTAARLLRGSEEAGRAGAVAASFTLSEVAERVGYGSEAAFSHAFRRWTGVAPGAYRRRRGGAVPAGAAFPL